jgi:hypothetical protein
MTLIGEPCEKKVAWVIKAEAGSELTLTCQSPQIGKISASIKV